MTRDRNRRARAWVLWVGLGILPACSLEAQEQPALVAEDLQEVAFRYLMREYSPDRIKKPASVLCLRHGEWQTPAMEAYRRQHPPDADRVVVGPMSLLTDMPPPFLQRFASHEPPVVPGSRCAPPARHPDDRWTDRETGDPAIVYAVSDPEPLPEGRALVVVEYHVGGLHAQGGLCVLEPTAGEWRVSWCRMTWVS